MEISYIKGGSDVGYFSNGTEGTSYQEAYCSECIHNQQEAGCPIWLLHMLHNYEECNKKESFLHILIPRSKDGLGNEVCSMFLPSLDPQYDHALASRCDQCGEVYHGGPCKRAVSNG